MTIEHVQNLVIGSGVAGKILAWTLAKQGQKTAVVERSMVGGSCPNVACWPSKNVIYSAKAVALVHPTKGLGVVTGPLRVDMAGVARRKRRMVERLVELHLLQAEVLSVTGRSGSGVVFQVRSGAAERTFEASDILVATSRTPNTDRLDVARAGVELDSRGYIRVNDRLQTSAPDVWATGECAGSPQFTHVGEDDCRVVLDSLPGGSRTTRGRLIPYCLFTDPELAHVGMTESEARAQDVPYRIARLPMARVLRTRTLSQTRGFMKALIGATTTSWASPRSARKRASPWQSPRRRCSAACPTQRCATRSSPTRLQPKD